MTTRPPGTAAGTVFEVVDATLERRAVSTNDPVVASVTVANGGDRAGRFVAGLRVAGLLVATKGIVVPPGESRTLTFERSFAEPGEYSLAVAGTALPDLVVRPADGAGAASTGENGTRVAGRAGGPDAVAVVGTSGLADWVRTGHNASVRVALANRGNLTAVQTVAVSVGGEPVANETVLLAPNERRTVSVGFPAVDGTVAVNGVEVGHLTVNDSWRETEELAVDATGDAGPGFGFGSVAAALVAAVLVGRALRLGRRLG